jgi:drug/metabolite transporter (DMT)-like permease
MIFGGLIFGGRVVVDDWKSVLMLTYLSLLSALAYSLWGMLLKYNPVSKVSIYNFMTPVFGVVLSWMLLTEESNVDPINLVISLLLVCAGIILLNYKKNK